MKSSKKILILITIIQTFSLFLNAQIFNKNLTADEKSKLQDGQVLIKNIDYQKYMCLDANSSKTSAILVSEIKKLSPKYLAEVIQIRPYQDNEDLAERLEEILNNVSDYAGIPYFSEKNQRYYNLYDSATIIESNQTDDKTIIKADLQMQPFGTVNESIEIIKDEDCILYMATNLNKLNYLGKFDCVWPQKMKICILLLRDGDNWILYGIGGVNAPRIPFFTERIETSFINRIKTFCNFIFNKI